jgi:hypothetical protein
VLIAAAGVALACAAGSYASASQREAQARQAPRRWCRAQPNAAWRRVLATRVLPLSRRVALVPWSLAHDGRSFFASIYKRGGWSGVARVDVPTARVTRIRGFAHPMTDQADGAFGGRWLVWNAYHSLENFDDFTTWAWNSRTGAVTQIGAAQRAPDGSFWVSPWRQPDVRDGIATWVQGSGRGGITDVHVYDLAQGRDVVAHTGHAQGSFLVAGPLVVWPESPARGTWTRMLGFDPASGQAVAPPPALQTLRGISGLYTDGHAIAFPSAKYKSLWVAPSLTATPRLVVTAPGANVIGNSVQINGRWVGFGIDPRSFLGNAKVGRYLQISRGGWTRIDRRSLVVVHAIASKQWGTPAPVAFVPMNKLPPIPACR